MPKKAKILQELEDYKPEIQIDLYKFRQADGSWVHGPHQFQKEIIKDTHRYKVVVCGRRFGKTSFAINELLYNALSKDGSVYWYVGPTYKQAKMIAWQMLEDILATLPPEIVIKRNEQELKLVLQNGSRIEIKGADNEDSLRGVALDGVVMDEYAFMKSRVFTKIIRPCLADRKGWAIFIGTPYGFNHFYELYQKGQGHDHEWKSWRFKSVDNPFIDPDEIQSARADSSPEVFAQEWEADFRMFKGLIYKDFDKDIHVRERELNLGSTFYRTMDFGASNPTACLWIEVDRDDNIYVFDEYYEPGHPIDYNAGVILARHKQFDYRATFGDPSALQEHIDYAHWQLYITPATRFFTSQKGTSESWVNAGISMVATVLRQDATTKQPRLFVSPKCVNLIREFQGYEWDEIRGVIVDKPKKMDDHALDALRYFICSYGGKRTAKEHSRKYQPNSSVTGY